MRSALDLGTQCGALEGKPVGSVGPKVRLWKRIEIDNEIEREVWMSDFQRGELILKNYASTLRASLKQKNNGKPAFYP